MDLDIKKEEFFMKKALALARKASQQGEIPVGAIIVDQGGNIIGRGYNSVEKHKTQLAHAELNAISKAVKKVGDWRLNGCTIYVTLEPCGMCFHAIGLSRISRIVYGAPSPLFGFHLDSKENIQIYQKHVDKIVKGVCEESSTKLLKSFFEKRRGEKHG